MNGVAVVVAQHEDVIVAADGRDNKATSLIRSDLSGDGVAVGVDVLCALVSGFLKGSRESWCLACGWNTGACNIGTCSWQRQVGYHMDLVLGRGHSAGCPWGLG